MAICEAAAEHLMNAAKVRAGLQRVQSLVEFEVLQGVWSVMGMGKQWRFPRIYMPVVLVKGRVLLHSLSPEAANFAPMKKVYCEKVPRCGGLVSSLEYG
eukprot:1611021-Rhodomonas_salina.3